MAILKLLGAVAFTAIIVCGQFATHNGVNFEVDGAPFSFAGTNIYDAGYSTTQYAADVISAVKADGYRVLRCWAFNDYDTTSAYMPSVYYQSWTNGVPTINTGANGLELLDTVVQQAEAAGIKLILTLTNNWSDYGGMDVYVNNTVGSDQPHDLFYMNAQIATYYQSYVNAVVSRYSTSPSIFAWELANEARCSGSGPNPQSSACNPDVITTWADTMSTYIKSIDPNHMVSFGGEGFFNEAGSTEYEYDGGSGQDYDALIALPNIDFGTIHLYIGSTSGYEDVAWSMQWLADHETSSVAANKPAVLEEYGIIRTDTTYPRQSTYDQWHAYEMSSQSINGDMTWGSLVVDTDCPGTDPYSICTTDSDYADLVTNWVTQMNGKQ